jgi:GAF domain-containing protein
MSPRRALHDPAVAIGTAVCLGIVLTLAVFSVTRSWDRERARLEFQREAERAGGAVERALAEGLDLLQAVGDLHGASASVSREQFRDFVHRPLAYSRGMRSLMWAPRVADGERARWEQGAGRGLGLPSEIVERAGDGRWTTAPRRPEYFPVRYLEPAAAGGLTFGSDLVSNVAVRKALGRARDAESPVVVDDGAQTSADDAELLVLLPVYRAPLRLRTAEERRDALVGYVAGVLRVGDIIESALVADSSPLRVRLARAPHDTIDPLVWRKPMHLGAETWSLQIAASSAYLNAHAGRRSWVVIPVGMLLTAGLAGALALELRRRRVLAQAAARLEIEMVERRRIAAATVRLATLGADLVSTLDPGEVAARVVAAVAGFCASRSTILYQLQAEPMRLVAAARVPEAGPLPAEPGAAERPLLERAMNERQPAGAGETVAVPLVAYGVSLGALLIVGTNEAGLSDEEKQLVVGFADQAALALANAANHRRATDRAEKLAALSALTRLITSTTSSRAVFTAIAKAAVTLLGAELGRVWVADPVRRTLRIEGRYGIDSDQDLRLTDVTEVPFGTGIVGKVYESVLPTYITDLRRETGGLRSVAALPLVTGDRVLGALAIVFPTPRSFSREEKELMALLANQAAIAIHNASLLETAHKGRQTAEGLADLGRSLTRSLDPEQVAQATAERVTALLACPSTALFVRRGRDAERVASAGVPLAATEPLALALAEVALTASETGAVVVSEDLAVDPARELSLELRAALAQEPVRAALAVPLTSQGVALGALVVANAAGRRFADHEIITAQACADRAAPALFNARLHAETQTQLARAEALLAVGQAVSGLADSTEVFRRATRALVRLLDADLGGMWTIGPEGDLLVPAAGYRLPPGLLDTLSLTSPATGGALLAEIARLPGACGWADSQAAVVHRDQPWTRALDHKSLMFVPLRMAEQVVGAITLAWTRAPHRFTDEELSLVDAVAGQLSVTLQNIRLVDQLRARQGRLETLLEVERQLSTIQPVASLLAQIVEACGRLLGSDSVGIRVVEGDELVVGGTWGLATAEMPTPRLAIGQSLSGQVAETGEVVIVNDLATDEQMLPTHREVILSSGKRAFLGVPVKIGERLLGVLSIRAGRPFSEDDVAIASAFASQAATTLENARLYQSAQQAYEELARTQEQLVVSQRMDAIGRLAGGIAHDFNNLLTVVTGRATLLQELLRSDPRLLRHAELIESTAKRAAALTQQLLAFSRRQVLQPRVVDVNRIVSTMSAMLKPLIGEQNELVLSLAPDLKTVRVDPAQFEQVVVNLVVNARDAMPEGGRITVTTANVEITGEAPAGLDLAPGAWVRLDVVDAGVGMDTAIRARIFEPFFTTKEQGKGTGLGLSTVYGIVQQSGGGIDVQSAPGLGTTMTVYLRVVEEAPAVVERDAAPPAVGGAETILLVEDEDEVRGLLEEILDSYGYRVLAAANGPDALALWQRHRADVDLVLTDVVMPRMSGPELVRRLRAAGADVAVVYMSGYTDLPLADAIAAEANAALLRKPFTPISVTGRIREVLDTGRTPVSQPG